MNYLKDPLVSDRPPLTSVFIVLLVILIGFLGVGNFIGLGVFVMLYDGDIADLKKSVPTDAMSIPLMAAQGAATLVGLIIIPLMHLKYNERKTIEPFFQKERDLLKILALIPVIGICFLIAISPISEWNMNFQFPEFLKDFGSWARAQEDKLMEMTKVLTTFSSPWEFIFGLIVIAILPGIGEELVFRGLLQNELWRSTKNIHIAIWTSAILFSAIHMQFFGFLPRLMLGAMFGYLYYWSGNLMIPMIAHFFHNGFTLTMVYLYNLGAVGIDMDSQESAPILLVAICGVVTFALLYIFRKHYTPHNLHDHQAPGQV